MGQRFECDSTQQASVNCLHVPGSGLGAGECQEINDVAFASK